jgi:DNA repair exonuclease SbcCD ATPase subunit
MLTLKELKFRCIGRFVEEQSISFDSLGKLIQVDGNNHNTGGSSGSGKSTIFNALDFLFGLNSIPNSVLQSRLTEDSMWVEGIFDYNGSPLAITRGKKLKIELNGEVTTGSAKISEEKLDQILVIPRHLFKPILHKAQGEKGFFLNFTPKETNDFLTDCLGLSNFKKPMLALDANIQDFNKKRETLTATLGSARTGLTASQNAVLSIGSVPVEEVRRETILVLKSKSDASTEAHARLLAAQKTEIEGFEILRPSSTFAMFDTSKKNTYGRELNSLKVQINQLLLSNKDRENDSENSLRNLKSLQAELRQKMGAGTAAEKQIIVEAGKIRKIRANMCPTCQQSWDTESSKSEEAQLLENIDKLRRDILGGQKALVDLEESNKQLELLVSNRPPPVPNGYQELLSKESELNNSIDKEMLAERLHNAQQSERNNNEQKSFMAKLSVLRDKHAKACEQSRGQAVLDKKILDESVMKRRAYDEALGRYTSTLNTLKVQENNYAEEIKSLSSELSVVDDSIQSHEELKKVVRSYLSCSFDEALDNIGETATKLIGNIPNMANAVIRLVGVRELKDGKIKEEVTATLSVDGEENVDIRSLSGGERASADLAIDLSVLELIENRTNVGINIFILDEPFHSLDSINSEQVLEMLKNSQVGKKVIIVDHNPMTKEFVNDRIMVERVEQFSKIA